MAENQVNQTKSVLKTEIDNLFLFSQVILFVLIAFLFSDIIQRSITLNTTIIIIGLIFHFVASFLLFLLWSSMKLTFRQDDVFAKTGKLDKKYWFASGILFGGGIIGIDSVLYFDAISQILPRLNESLLLIFSLIFLLILIIDFNRISHNPERPNGYINKFLVSEVKKRDPQYHNSITTVSVLFFSFILLPIAFFNFFIINDIISAIVIWTIILSLMYGGYWSGYGSYRSYRWLLGLNPLIKKVLPDSNDLSKIAKLEQLGIRYTLAVLVGIITIFYLFGIGLLLISIQLNILPKISALIATLLTFGVFLGLLKLFIQSVSRTSKPQPWYSFLFINFLLLLPFFWTTLVKSLFNIENAPIFMRALINLQNISLILSIAFGLGIIVLLITNSRHLQEWIWKDSFESNQMLNEINLKLKAPKPLHLNILARMGEIQENSDSLMKLMSIYQTAFEKKIINTKEGKGIAESLAPFINKQLFTAQEWRLHALSFDLSHKLLEFYPEYKDLFYPTIIKISNHKDPMVRQAVLNFLGHFIQLEPNLDKIDEIFPIITQIYEDADEDKKKSNLQAFQFIIIRFESYRERILNYFVDRLEQETFGVATEIFALLEILVDVEPDTYHEKILNLSKKVLEELDHSGKLGAIRFIANKFPQLPQEGAPIIRLFMKNLKDDENALGVRTNILYTLGDIIPDIPQLSSLLPDLAYLLDDSDPDVRTALIQITCDLFPYKDFIPSEIFQSYIDAGTQDEDYLVRLVTLQSVHKLLKTNPLVMSLVGNFIIERGMLDESHNVREALVLFLEEFKDIIPEGWFGLYVKPYIGSLSEEKLKRRLKAIGIS